MNLTLSFLMSRSTPSIRLTFRVARQNARNRGQLLSPYRFAVLNAVVGNNPRHLATSAEVHKLTRARPFLIRVIQHQAIQTCQDILQIEVQFGIGFQSALKVFSQGGLSTYLSIRDTQKLLGNRRDQFDSFIIVADDRFQIMLPRCNPKS